LLIEKEGTRLLTEEEVKEIRERAEKATPGPWTNEYEFKDARTWENGRCYQCDEGLELVAECETPYGRKEHTHKEPSEKKNALFSTDTMKDILFGDGWEVDSWGVNKQEDAEFIAHAREDIPKLLQEREELLKKLEGLRPAGPEFTGEY
jgi:hypothetical protein